MVLFLVCTILIGGALFLKESEEDTQKNEKQNKDALLRLIDERIKKTHKGEPLNILSTKLDEKIVRFYFDNLYLKSIAPKQLVGFRKVHQDPKNVADIQWIIRVVSEFEFMLESKAYPGYFLYFSEGKGFRIGKINYQDKKNIPEVAIFRIKKKTNSFFTLKLSKKDVYFRYEVENKNINFTESHRQSQHVQLSYQLQEDESQ